MRLVLGILLAVAVGATALHAEDRRPNPGEMKEFVADPIPFAASSHFKDFKIAQKDLEGILKNYFQVEEEHWRHGYSHVAFGDRTGHVILHDGRKLKWLVKPGGLAWLEFPTGKKMYLAAEKTNWPLKK